MRLFHKNISLLGGIGVVLCGAVLGYYLLKPNIDQLLVYLVSKDIHPLGFLFFFLLLPMVGFPIIPFLVIIGVKFGVKQGTIIMFVGMLIHLVVSFLLTHFFLHHYVERFAQKRNIRLPQFQEDKIIWFSFLFMAIPGLSYAMKNYLLPLSGISFRHHLGIGCLTQGTMGIPFVVLGHAAAGQSFYLLGGVMLILASFYAIILYLKNKKRGLFIEEKDKS